VTTDRHIPEAGFRLKYAEQVIDVKDDSSAAHGHPLARDTFLQQNSHRSAIARA
jgi:hypothetical protein